MKTQTHNEATARPWEAVELEYSWKLQLVNNEARAVVMLSHDGSEEGQANAALIVRAVNEYEALLVAAETLKAIIDANDSYGDVIGGKLVSDAKSALARLTSIQKGQA